MVDNASENADVTAFLDFDRVNIEILGKFQFDNHECLIVQYDDESRECDLKNSDSFSEISRFNVKGQCCAILQKASDQESNDINLSVLLSTRELQIATLVALGCPNKQVADKLHISEWTVATYLRRIFAKLHVDTRAAMTYRCASLICKQDLIKK
jgi:DNA-binding CsgD family transcriptional regulator